MYTISAQRICKTYFESKRALCVGLEKHFKIAISCNQTLQATIEFVKFSDYLPLN